MSLEFPLLVDQDWVLAHPEAVLADVRWYLDGRDGRAAFEARHITGAVFVDLNVDLSSHGAPTDGRHPLPTPAAFVARMEQLGITPDTALVAYDDSGGGTAGRLVWMWRALGRDAALLDGGLNAWTGPTATSATAKPDATSATAKPDATSARLPAAAHHERHFVPESWPSNLLVRAETIAARAGSTLVVLDARSAERFRGENEPVESRAGHIPGAVSAPWNANLDPDTGRFRSAAQLRARFEALGITDRTDVAGSCGSGVSTCANLIALELAGFPAAKLYVASFSGWAADPDRVVDTSLGADSCSGM